MSRLDPSRLELLQTLARHSPAAEFILAESSDPAAPYVGKMPGELLIYDEFDVEQAIFWFACGYHNGQATNLYSVLSLSPYTPGPLERLQSLSDQAKEYYHLLIHAHTDPLPRHIRNGDVLNRDGN